MVSEGHAKIKSLTTDIGEAVEGVDCVFVTTTSFAHESLADKIAPHLGAGQTVVVIHGLAGSMLFFNALKKISKEKDITIAETEATPFSCRVFAPGKVRYKNRTRNIRFSAFPAVKTMQVYDMLKSIFDLKISKNVLETAILTVNQIVFPIPILLNLSFIEQKKGKTFVFPDNGLTPYVSRTMEALDNEKLAICRKLGFEPIPVDDMYREHGRKIPPFRLGGVNTAYRTEANMMKERFYPPYEDVMYGLVLTSDIGHAYGVPTPIADAVITLSSVIKGIDMLKEGRTLEKLGLSGMTLNELNDYLDKGTL
jgi:opine dehydrogenase